MPSTRRLLPKHGKRCTVAVTHSDNGSPDKLCGKPATLNIEGCPTCARHARSTYGLTR